MRASNRNNNDPGNRNNNLGFRLVLPAAHRADGDRSLTRMLSCPVNTWGEECRTPVVPFFLQKQDLAAPRAVLPYFTIYGTYVNCTAGTG